MITTKQGFRLNCWIEGIDMGQAKRRGDYVSRRAEAVADGRVKRRRISAKSMEEEIMKSTFPLVMSHLFFRFKKKK